jgi:hypothetical protein
MKKSILAFVMVAIVVGAAQPAVAIDDGFRGRYRLIGRDTGGCFSNSQRRRVEVGYVDERVRTIDPDHSTLGALWRLRYVRGEEFPWQTDDGRFVLRYRPRTDSAVGILDGIQECVWRVRLVSMG